MFSPAQFTPDGETSRSHKQIKEIVHSSPKLTSQNSQGEHQIKGRKHLCPIAQFDKSYSARNFMPKQLPAFFHIYYLAIFWPNTKSTPVLGSHLYCCCILLFQRCISPLFDSSFSEQGGNPSPVLVQDLFQTTAKASGDEEGTNRRNSKTIRSTESFILAAPQDYPGPRPNLLKHKEFYC